MSAPPLGSTPCPDDASLLVGAAVELRIEDLARDGRGVGRCRDQVVFVDGALPGDRLLARLRHRGRRHWQAEIEKLLDPSPDRRRAPCILADHCGSCSLQFLEDQAQQRWKQGCVEQAMRRIAGLDAPLRPLIASPSGLGYRNRAVIPLERAEGRLRAGYYRRGSHRIVNMNHCPVLDPRLDALIAPIKADLEASDWPVDRHGSEGGGLRHLALRIGRRSGEVLITLIASHDRLPGLEPLAMEWQRRWPAVVGVGLNLQGEPGNLLMGPQTRTLAGRGWLVEAFAGLELRIAADTFFQVHTEQAERMVDLLRQALSGDCGTLLDAYSGIGTFSLPLAAVGWSVLGLEQQGAAVDLARGNAERNGLAGRARFETASVDAVLAQHLEGMDVLFVDPPRKGLEAKALAAILAGGPARLLYLSCDPATLARDLGMLHSEGGYRIESLQPIDFFPNTSHVETLAVLRR
ncbi:MAG: 23S rRNA (uracil(1939)-C(5))-methyltransferase RlmD [Cyanobium sp.]